MSCARQGKLLSCSTLLNKFVLAPLACSTVQFFFLVLSVFNAFVSLFLSPPPPPPHPSWSLFLLFISSSAVMINHRLVSLWRKNASQPCACPNWLPCPMVIFSLCKMMGQSSCGKSALRDWTGMCLLCQASSTFFFFFFCLSMSGYEIFVCATVTPKFLTFFNFLVYVMSFFFLNKPCVKVF